MKVLDYRRLGKQRVEAKQLLNVIDMYHNGTSNNSKKPGWINHPAAVMWREYVTALRYYLRCAIEEWKGRGYKNTMDIPAVTKYDVEYPWWFGYSKFHSSHRSNLIRKDATFYGKYGWGEKGEAEYWWPQQSLPKGVTANVQIIRKRAEIARAKSDAATIQCWATS